jgi:hypothetical protein
VVNHTAHLPRSQFLTIHTTPRVYEEFKDIFDSLSQDEPTENITHRRTRERAPPNCPRARTPIRGAFRAVGETEEGPIIRWIPQYLLQPPLNLPRIVSKIQLLPR